MAPNVFLLAADNSPSLLDILRENPALASQQDEHGYSLVHAAASYNHLQLLRLLITEFKVDVNIKDEDNETALFVIETIAAAKLLVEELGVDVNHRGLEGFTAQEKIAAEDEFPEISLYLASKGDGSTIDSDISKHSGIAVESNIAVDGMNVTVSTSYEDESSAGEIDESFRQRIEEFAQREDFNTPSGQADLRKLVEEALLDQNLGDSRNVRTRNS